MHAGTDPRTLAGRREGVQGFTLIELLVVVAIIAIIASLAIPNFQKLAAKSRRAEAYYVLKAISAYQLEYQAETDGFADTFDELGFRLPGGDRVDERTIRGSYYTYTTQALAMGGSPRANYRVMAVGDIDPLDPILDILIIENQLTVLE